MTLHKKWSFLLRISLVFFSFLRIVLIYREILNEKLHFLCSVVNTRNCLLIKSFLVNGDSSCVYMRKRVRVISLQTLHVYSTLKRRGNVRFHVFSTWHTRGVFLGLWQEHTAWGGNHKQRKAFLMVQETNYSVLLTIFFMYVLICSFLNIDKHRYIKLKETLKTCIQTTMKCICGNVKSVYHCTKNEEILNGKLYFLWSLSWIALSWNYTTGKVIIIRSGGGAYQNLRIIFQGICGD